jgi:hypothetical protein
MSAECPRLMMVSQYVDDELSSSEVSDLVEHLKSCRQCSDELAALARIRATMASVPVNALARDRIFKALQRNQNEKTMIRRKISVPLPVAAAVLLALSVSIIANAYMGARRAQTPNMLPTKQSEPLKTSPAKQVQPHGESLASSKPTEKHVPANGAKQSKELTLVTFECDQVVTQFITDSKYHLNQTPTIHAGGFYSPDRR